MRPILESTGATHEELQPHIVWLGTPSSRAIPGRRFTGEGDHGRRCADRPTLASLVPHVPARAVCFAWWSRNSRMRMCFRVSSAMSSVSRGHIVVRR
jgi:hypothetical protein